MTNNNNRTSMFTICSRFVLFAAMALTLAGCNTDLSDLEEYVNTVRAVPAKPIEPIPVIKPYVRYMYPGQKIDPFDASILAPETVTERAGTELIDENRVPEYLEGFPLESLRMVGTVFQDNALWALVRVPDGSVHRVRKGNYIGRNHGKIIDVNDVSVGLNEIVEDGLGGYKERENQLNITNPNKN